MTLKNSIAPKKKPMQFMDYIEQDCMREYINLRTEGQFTIFRSRMLDLFKHNPRLSLCDPMSIIEAALEGITRKLSIMPSFGHVFIIPHYDPNTDTCHAQFVLGYKGLHLLATVPPTSPYKKICVHSIKEGELEYHDLLTDEIKIHMIEDDFIRMSTPSMGYHAMFAYKNGFEKRLFWTKNQMIVHAEKYTSHFDRESYQRYLAGDRSLQPWKYDSMWYRDFDTMARKTLLMELIRTWGYVHEDLDLALSNDNIVFAPEGKTDSKTSPEEMIKTELIGNAKDSSLTNNINKTKTISKQSETIAIDDSTEDPVHSRIEDMFFGTT